jgi:hypothetical protein
LFLKALNDTEFLRSKSPPHMRATCWANRLARQLAQLCIFTAHVGKTTQQQHNWQNHLHFPPFCSKSHEETMVCHWLIDSNSSALSSQHPQTLRFFLARRKISNTMDISSRPREVKSSRKLSAHEAYSGAVNRLKSPKIAQNRGLKLSNFS